MVSAQVSLCISFATENSLDDASNFKFLAESTAKVNYLIYYQMLDMDTVAQQLLKRLYWLLFVALW
jgi:hypothetical protein